MSGCSIAALSLSAVSLSSGKERGARRNNVPRPSARHNLGIMRPRWADKSSGRCGLCACNAVGSGRSSCRIPASSALTRARNELSGSGGCDRGGSDRCQRRRYRDHPRRPANSTGSARDSPRRRADLLTAASTASEAHLPGGFLVGDDAAKGAVVVPLSGELPLLDLLSRRSRC